MNDYVEALNHLGENFWGFAWPMLWQSSLLIAVVFAFDWLLARRIRASVRYALWMVVLVKLLLPPALALPTGATWWLWRPHPVVEPPVIKNYTVSFGDTVPDAVPTTTIPVVLPAPKLSNDAWVLLAAILTGVGWLSWLAFRWLRVAGKVRRAVTAPAELNAILDEARQSAALRPRPQLKMIDDTQSPAVYGLFRPVILLPRTLVNQLSGRQLRAVLLHEAVHLRRGDVWVNCAQTFLQIAYWWHPLLWLANVRIRRLREEAVDDAVMLALRDGADAYAPTLLEVAKFAFRRPLASLGLVGILEPRSALRQRVERLVDFRPPRRAGVTVLSLCGIFAFSAVALPMGQGPATGDNSTASDAENGTTVANQRTLTETFVVQKPIREKDLQQLLLQAGVKTPPTILVYLKDGRLLARGTADQLADIERVVRKLNGISPAAKDKPKILITVDASGHTFLNNEPVTMPMLRERLEAIKSQGPNPKVMIKAANEVAWQHVSDVVDTLRQLNIKNVSLRTEANPTDPAYIHLDVSYKSRPLNEVLSDLTERSRELDLNKRGLHFIFRPQQSSPNTINPSTGLPNQDTGTSELDNPSNIMISVTLNNVSLAHVPDAICSAAEHHLDYSIDNGTVIFTSVPQYEIRTFRVIPTTFYSNLKNNVPADILSAPMYPSGSLPPPYETPQPARNVSALAKAFFSRLGVNLDPPKTVFFNDRLGVLFVYASPQDLDVIEKAVEVLNDDPPMIHIKARFIQVPQKFLSSAVGKSLISGLTNGSVLPNPEFQVLWRAVKSQEGSEEVAEPEVTTIAGRQTQMRATITQQIITNFTFEASAGAIAGSAGPYGRFSDGSAFVPQTEQVRTGPILDVFPDLLSDGYTIHLKTIASHIDFLGYSTSGGVVPNVTTNVAGTGFSPAFQVREASLNKNLWDGQTLVLFPQYKVVSDGKTNDRISNAVEEKNRDKVEMVLVTATLIDPAGNRLHSEDELPFAQTGVPQSL